MVLDTLRPTTSGDRPPAFCLLDNAKVQHFSCVSKFRPSNWADFDEEFIEIAHARQNSCEHDSVLA